MPILEETSRLLRVLDAPVSTEGLEMHYRSRFSDDWSQPEYSKIRRFDQDPKLLRKLMLHNKQYPSELRIELPQRRHHATRDAAPNAADDEKIDLFSTIHARRSCRSFSEAPVEAADLADLLGHAYGAAVGVPARTAPSAGRRFPIEVYPLVVNVRGLSSGIYHYNVDQHCLEAIRIESEMSRVVGELGFGENIDFQDAAFVLVLTGVFHRTSEKYGRRGARFVYLDAGHVAQNLWLVATALRLGCTELGGGWDSKICDLLQLNAAIEAPLVSLVFGSE